MENTPSPAGLTIDQIRFAQQQVVRWLLLKERHEPTGWHSKRDERRWDDGEFAQLRADASHSALLRRLLSGKEPLPEPPPLKHAYPDYPD